MAVWWVVFNRREQTAKQPERIPVGAGTMAPADTTSTETNGVFSGQLEDACVVRIEGSSITTAAKASAAVKAAYPGFLTGRPCAIEDAEFKEPL